MKRICSVVSIVLLSGQLACGETEKNAPLPEPDLEARNTAIQEVKEKRALLESATAEQALSLLQHKDHRVRRAALKRLGKLKQAPKPAVDALLSALNDSNDEVRIEAAIALTTIRDKTTVKPLIRALVDPNDKVRQWAYKALRKLGSDAIPEMIAALTASKNNGKELEEIIIESLAEMGKAAVPHLVTAITQHDGKTAREAVTLLGKIGKDAAGGIFALLEILNSSDDTELKKRAIVAIGEIGDRDPEVVPTLISFKEGAAGPLKAAAAKALKKIEADS